MPLIELVKPSLRELPEYIDALHRGWSPDNIRPAETAREHLTKIDVDAIEFLAGLEDREAKGPPITLPDGTFAVRLPGFVRWIMVGDFCGTIGFRWQPGGSALPPHVLGHIGFGIVPWKRGAGYAAQALTSLLPELRLLGLPYVELTVDPDNLASQKTILACNGTLVERFKKLPAYGGAETLRFRINLREVWPGSRAPRPFQAI